MAAEPSTRRNQVAAGLAVVGGVLLLVAGFSAAGVWATVYGVVAGLLPSFLPVDLAFFVVIVLGSLGGLVVLVGGILFLAGSVRLGRFLVLLGSGFGIITLVLMAYLQLSHGELPFVQQLGLNFLGVVLALAGRMTASRPEAPPSPARAA